MQLSRWEKESFYAPADVLIAGGGFVGLWSAWWLRKKNPRLRITLIDRGVIPSGASTRNAGFACFGSPTELLKDAALSGEDQMLTLVEKRFRGLQRIQKVFGTQQIDFLPDAGYELIDQTALDRFDDLPERVNHLNKLLRPVLGTGKTFRFADKKIPVFGFSRIRHLIRTDLEGNLHPGKLCQLLLQAVQALGVTVLTGLEIKSYEEDDRGIRVFTDKEIVLSARQLLVCTNGFARRLLPGLPLTPARGQVLVTAPIPSLTLRGSFHFDEGFYYFRNLGKRILLGGARNLAIEQETTTEQGITENIQQALETFLQTTVIPGVPFEVTDRWSGIMAMGPEKTPIIRHLSPRIFCAVRMGGMGVALAPMAGRQIAGMMLDS